MEHLVMVYFWLPEEDLGSLPLTLEVWGGASISKPLSRQRRLIASWSPGPMNLALLHDWEKALWIRELPLIQRHNVTYSFVCKSLTEHLLCARTMLRGVQGK